MQLVEFLAKDELHLYGLLCEPEQPTETALIMLHGNGSSTIFHDVDAINTIAPILNQAGVTYFPFDNRGAGDIQLLKKGSGEQKERIWYGMAYELMKECLLDIDAAVAFLKAKGYKNMYLIGYSTGATKICLYDYYKPENELKGYILAGGGDDTGIWYNELGENGFYMALESCQKALADGKGRELAPPELVGSQFMSYQSLYDTINPEGDYNVFPFFEALYEVKLSETKPLFQEFSALSKPALAVYGEFDEYCYGQVPKIVELLKKTAPSQVQFKIMSQSDHGFHGKVAELTADCLAFIDGVSHLG